MLDIHLNMVICRFLMFCDILSLALLQTQQQELGWPFLQFNKQFILQYLDELQNVQQFGVFS